jgi:acyl-CoA hydrolase
MIELAAHVPAGAGIWWGQGSAEPTPLVHALLDQMDTLGPHRAFCGITWDARLTRELPAQLSLTSYAALGDLRRLSQQGRLTIVPCHYSALPRLFAERLLPSEVGMVQVSPPDGDGMCSLGTGADYAADAVRHTTVLLAEINRRMPATSGTERIPIGRFAATIETDRPLAEAPVRAVDDVERAIAANVAELIADGDTIQLGVGALPSAVAEQLTGHRDLGCHSGTITDAVLRLIDSGVLTGARKEIDTGVVVTGSALGTAALYDRLPALPVAFRPASYTHAPAVLAQLRSLVAINSAVEVDLAGQVGAETRRGSYVGGVGGQVDFSRAAALTGARSIITLRSRSGTRSTIVPRLPDGVVTTGRADVDFVVTEYGAASLRGCDLTGRADRLIAVAAPEQRDWLRASTRS